MSAGLEFTIREHLQYQSRKEVIDEIKSKWPIKDYPSEVKKAIEIVNRLTGHDPNKFAKMVKSKKQGNQ